MRKSKKNWNLEYRTHAALVGVFWMMNALEKFQLLGKNRWEQISKYLLAFGVPDGSLTVLVPTTLTVFGIIEGAAATCALLALLKGPGRGYMRAAISLSLIMFTVFIIGDVVAVERDLLFQHLIYATTFIVQGAALRVRDSLLAASVS